jgi:putative phosphonate metabolism protein
MSHELRKAGTRYPRYAIYFATARGDVLDRFGAGLLGYDAWTGEDLPFSPDITGAEPDWRELTEDPRKYGFHATLKAPIALAEGKTEAELLTACAAFAEKPHRIPIIVPVVDAISGFIAVIPKERSIELKQLAADCVVDFDAFRAPLTAEDRARRNPARLSERQRDYLDRWGYPYVMEEFRFHMTLTGRIESPRRERVTSMLRDRFARTDLERLAVDAIALFRQDDATSRFRTVDRWQLRAAE